MDGLPVVIRLIDPPLHEFLPNLEEQLVKVTRAEMQGGASEEDKQLLATIRSLHEQNPMLGLRGCRLGLMIPDFVKVQTRAILNAQIAVKRAGGNPIAKIMIPLVGHPNELKRTKELLEAEVEAVEAAAGGVDVDYKFGTMIEVPRGALVADEIAQKAEVMLIGYAGGGVRNIFSNKPATTLAELKGLKVRVQGAPIWSKTFAATGMAPTVIAYNEVYNAIQNGVINAGENEAAGVESMKFYEVGPNLLMTEHAITIRPIGVSADISAVPRSASLPRSAMCASTALTTVATSATPAIWTSDAA